MKTNKFEIHFYSWNQRETQTSRETDEAKSFFLLCYQQTFFSKFFFYSTFVHSTDGWFVRLLSSNDTCNIKWQFQSSLANQNRCGLANLYLEYTGLRQSLAINESPQIDINHIAENISHWFRCVSTVRSDFCESKMGKTFNINANLNKSSIIYHLFASGGRLFSD